MRNQSTKPWREKAPLFRGRRERGELDLERRGERKRGPHILTWRELGRSYEPKRPRHTKNDLFYFSPHLPFRFLSLYMSPLIIYFIKNKKVCFIFLWIPRSMFDLLVSEARLVSLSLSSWKKEEEGEFLMVFGIRCHVPVAECKAGSPC